MPSRNTVKQYDTQAFYHVYNRGAGGQKIFKDTQDRQKFLSFIARYATPKDERDEPEALYPEYDIEVNAYCLMGNHFHLLLYQNENREAISGFMRSVLTSYSMYFNKKYNQYGHLFQSIFKAKWIRDESYLEHITRYIHMNPRTYMTYRWSSLGAYIGGECGSWLKPDKVQIMTSEQYRRFLQDYESTKEELEYIKSMLAG